MLKKKKSMLYLSHSYLLIRIRATILSDNHYNATKRKIGI